MAGSDHSGEDMQAGRTNRAENHTRVWAQEEGGEGSFGGDAILVVEAAGDIENDDFHIPTSRIHGILATGVFEGVGVIGFSPSELGDVDLNRAAVERVQKVGVFGRGETGVAGEGGDGAGVEGIGGTPTRPPGASLSNGGTGVIGRGGRRPESGAHAEGLHGAGVIGMGGSLPSDMPDSDEAGSVGVYGRGAEGAANRRPGVGVVGRSGAITDKVVMPGVLGITPSAFTGPGGPSSRDTGVLGLGGTGVTGLSTDGPGVLGEGGGGSGGPLSTVNPDKLAPGVVGVGGVGLSPASNKLIRGTGVIGFASDLTSFSFVEAGETGVYGTGETGVKGVGSEGRGGVFSSQRSAQVQLIPSAGVRISEQQAFIPTVATEPGRLALPLPRAGRNGDLMTIADDQGQCTLWFCSHSAVADVPARWTQVLLGPAFDGRV
jgi:hypothetical protein